MPASPLSRTTCPSPLATLRPALPQQRHLRLAAHQGREPGGPGHVQATLRRAFSQHLVHAHGRLDPLEAWVPRSWQRKYPCTRRAVASLITTVSGAASPWRRAARLGVSPRARCSCRPPLPISPTTTSPVWMPIRTARRTPCVLHQAGIQRPHGLQDAQAGAHGTLRVIFMRLRIAKVDEQAIAQILRNMPVKALDDLGTGGLVGAHDLAQVFGVELPAESGSSRPGHRTAP